MPGAGEIGSLVLLLLCKRGFVGERGRHCTFLGGPRLKVRRKRVPRRACVTTAGGAPALPEIARFASRMKVGRLIFGFVKLKLIRRVIWFEWIESLESKPSTVVFSAKTSRT